MIQHKYFFSKNEDIRISIRSSEQKFHKSHAPLYANHLFCNSFVMSKIEKHLIDVYPGTVIVMFDDILENQCEKLKRGALTCGYELIDGKIDMEANYQIAKYSQNALALGFDSINGDDLLLVRDDSVANNAFILKYIPDNDDEDDTEVIYAPENEHEVCLC